MYRPVFANRLRLLSLVCCAWMLSASSPSQAQQRWPSLFFGQPTTAPLPADDVPRNDGGAGGAPVVVDDPLIDEPVIDEPVVDEPLVDEPIVDDVTPWQEFLSEPFPLLRFLILFLTQLLEALEEIAGGNDGGTDTPPIGTPPADRPTADTPLNTPGR